jgi:hypothetical protein
MAFISNGSNVISFAEYQDVFDADQRIFDLNEGLTDDVIETSLVRATERILTRVRSTDWWKSYYITRDTSPIQVADIPAPSANKIVDRRNDFTELCVAVAMSEYILPKIADFGAADNAEKNKMGYYLQRSDKIFAELITAGDWYDFDGSGVVASVEKQATHVNLRRIR